MEKFSKILERQNNRSTLPKETTEIDVPDVPTDFKIKCRVCNDAGILHPRLPSGKPDYASTIPCRACATPETIRRSLNISSTSATLDSLEPVKGMESALKCARQLVMLKTAWKMMLIYGTNGNGKTHIMEGIALELYKQGYRARVQSFPDFMGQLKDTFDRSAKENDRTFEDLILSVCSTPFLLMDDVGLAGSFTPFSQAQLERIILARYRVNLFTVMTTNRDLEELPLSVRSRFNDAEKARLVHNAAPDYRPLKKAVR